DAQRLRVVVEAPAGLEAPVERPFAGMAERRVAEIVRPRERFGEILVEPQRPRQRARGLGGLQGMRLSRAEVVAFVEHEGLGTVGQPAERRRMDDAVAIAAKDIAHRADRLGNEPATAVARIGRVTRARNRRLDGHLDPTAWRAKASLTEAGTALNYR